MKSFRSATIPEIFATVRMTKTTMFHAGARYKLEDFLAGPLPACQMFLPVTMTDPKRTIIMFAHARKQSLLEQLPIASERRFLGCDEFNAGIGHACSAWAGLILHGFTPVGCRDD